MKIRIGAARAVGVCLLLAGAGVAHAIAPLHEDSTQAHAPLPAWRPGNEPQLNVAPSLQSQAQQSVLLRTRTMPFQQRFGGQWDMRWDSRADRPNVVEGSGIPLLPGRGNVLAAPRGGVDLAYVATQVQGLFAQMPELLRLEKMDLRLDAERSGAFGPSSTFWFVELQQFHDGVPVDGAFAYARISHGNVVQFGTERLAEVTASGKPRQSREDAFAQAWAQLDFPDGVAVADIVDDGALRFYPVLPLGEAPAHAYAGMPGYGYDHVLAWRYVFRLDQGDATYEVLFDSAAQRILAVNNLTVNADVTGGVYPTTNTDAEIVLPLPFVAVTNNGAKVTNADGQYGYTAGTATSALDGQYFRMNDNCGAISLSNSTDGNLAFGTSGGTDCTTPGFGGAGNTHASRTGHHHLSRINEKARAILTTNSWLQTKVTANMNVVDVCNAGWNGSQVSFFRSGSGCSNTGEIAAVFLHEWGHGMDQNSGGASSENGSGEAVGDTFAFLETRDSCIGPNFRPGVPCFNCTSCTGVRDVEMFSTRGPRTIARPSTVGADGGLNCDRYACPYLQQGVFPYQGPMGFQGHCESHIASGSTWDLTLDLVERYGDEGWQRMDDLWYSSLVPSKSAYRVASGGQCNVAAQVDGCGATNWYTVFLAANDDDGNLANGTPDACRIFDAFDAHGIACGTRPVCNQDAPGFDLTLGGSPQRVCAADTAEYTIAVGSLLGFDAAVTLVATGTPAQATATFTPNPVLPGTSTALQIATGADTPAGSYPIDITGTADGADSRSVSALLVVDAAVPAVPVLASPADRASVSAGSVTFAWAAVPGAVSYRLEVARDALFTDLLEVRDDLATPTATVSGIADATRYYWRVTASNSCGTGAVSDVFSFASGSTRELACRAPNLAIPDNNTTGATDTLTLAEPGNIAGLQLSIRATHSYIGDVSFTLGHGGTDVSVIDRPGRGATGNGCSANDIDVLLDDAAATDAESQCNATPPALGGVQRPNNAMNTALAGQAWAGAWTLRAVDAAGTDTGTLHEWCLIAVEPATPAYSVGGTVGGLAGTGLVLALNGGVETVVVAADGSYAFTTLVDAGASYAVTVAAQPGAPTQVCSVANGSGTVGAADITDVDVSCTAPSFQVGGSVSGLLGAGLQLQLGAQVLDIAADGSFVFAGALPDGGAYSVSIAAQPLAPSQTCSIADADGTIDGADVTSVLVTCVTNSYRVGGTVTGLVGSGLVLVLDGGEPVLISADGTFVFAAPRADGSSYAVTVATHPRAPVQRCTVEQGNGTLSGADATDIVVTCVTLPLGIFADGLEIGAP